MTVLALLAVQELAVAKKYKLVIRRQWLTIFMKVVRVEMILKTYTMGYKT